MKLDTVTFSGGSQNNSIDKMIEIASENPFVEWGIQTPHYGSGIFPSQDWVKGLCEAARGTDVKLSAHLCVVY